jgi:hypothetical protein
MWIAVVVVVAALVAAWLIWTARKNELFRLAVQNGKAAVVRGNPPTSLLADFEDVLRGDRDASGTIRAVRTASHTQLVIRGLDDATAQRLRNVFGTYPISRLRRT